MAGKKRSIWVFGDYRNYFQNRVTLQLISRARDLAGVIGAEVCVTVFGHRVDEWVMEYTAHGADKLYVCDHEELKFYSNDIYVHLMERLVREHSPEILLVGATTFGREFAPRLAKRLKTGLTADCIGLDIDGDGLLVQTAPAFGGNLVTRIITPERRPQMATVRPGTFQEIPHNYQAKGEIVPASCRHIPGQGAAHKLGALEQREQCGGCAVGVRRPGHGQQEKVQVPIRAGKGHGREVGCHQARSVLEWR
jgi:electron transfer flavoprotein alpha subunit